MEYDADTYLSATNARAQREKAGVDIDGGLDKVD